MNLISTKAGLAGLGFAMVVNWGWAQSLAYAPWVPLQSAPSRDYDIRFGELFFDLEATISLEYNTNITASEENEISDFIISPGISAGGSWAYSDFNTLRFGIGLKYRYYLSNPELGSNGSVFDLTPETEIDTIILIGEAYIRLFDRVTYSTDATDSIGVDTETGELIFNSTDYGILTNTLGAQISYDLNFLQTSAQIYRRDTISFEDDFDFLDYVEYSVSGTVSRRIFSTLTAGVGGGVSALDYESVIKGDIDSLNFGVFSNAVLTPFISLYGGVNWGFSEVSAVPGFASSRDSDSFSYNITLSHTLNAYFDHSVGFTSVRRLGCVSDFVETKTIRYDWNLEEWLFVDLSGYVAWEQGDEEGGALPESFDRFSVSVQASYVVGPRSELRGRVTFVDKDSNRDLRSYRRSVFWLEYSYDF
ncbi:MAG: hypothetical protein AAGB06_02080 [Verrucomicrobiota bacterium]